MFHWIFSQLDELPTAYEAACPRLMLRVGGSFLTALLIAAVGGHLLVAWLRRMKVGERTDRTPIEDEKLRAQINAKAGTPTMGGIIILAGLLPAFLLWADLTSVYLWLAMGSFLAFAAIGFADDWMKLTGRGHRQRGFRVRHKLIIQAFIGVGIGVVVWQQAMAAGAQPGVSLPLLGRGLLPLGAGLIVWVALVTATMSNAVNVTDGLDGLATGLSIVTVIGLGGVALWAGSGLLLAPYGLSEGPHAAEMLVFCAALFGALFGFLYHNLHPARVFMGDTGALALGGTFATVAVILRVELLLPLIAFVFLVEFASTVLQVLWFKTTGKRILPIAPIHHWFQQLGWREPNIVLLFCVVGILVAMASLAVLPIVLI